MEVAQLKQIATNHGIEFHKNSPKDKMIRLLKDNKVYVPGIEDELAEKTDAKHLENIYKPQAAVPHTSFDGDIKKCIFTFKQALSQVDLKFANQERDSLKKKIKEAEDRLALRKLLVWERSRKLISVEDSYLLNEIESSDELDLCQCSQNMSASGMHTRLGEEYKFKKYFDESRGTDIFVIYVHRIIKRDEQIGRELAWKMRNGFMPEDEDFPQEKTLIHRFPLRESEFSKYFTVVGEDDSELMI